MSVEQIRAEDGTRYRIHARGKAVQAQGNLAGSELNANLDGYLLRASVAEHDGSVSLYTQDSALGFSLVSPDLGDLDDVGAGGGLTAPMNGTMVTLLVDPGSEVKADDALLVMEAMKMEHTIRAPKDGKVVAFYYQPGDLVTQRLPGNLPHIAIVTNRRAKSGSHALVVHNIGAGTRIEDRLFEFRISGHFRFAPTAG